MTSGKRGSGVFRRDGGHYPKKRSVDYACDDQNRLIERAADLDGLWGTLHDERMEHFLYDGSQMVLQFEDGGNVSHRCKRL